MQMSIYGKHQYLYLCINEAQVSSLLAEPKIHPKI